MHNQYIESATVHNNPQNFAYQICAYGRMCVLTAPINNQSISIEDI